MARIEQDKLNDTEKLVLSILVHCGQVWLPQLTWVAHALLKESYGAIPPHPGIPIDMFVRLVNRNTATYMDEAEAVFALKQFGLLNMETPGGTNFLRVPEKEHMHVKVYLSEHGKQYAAALAKGWNPRLHQPDERKLFIANAASHPDAKALVDDVIKPVCENAGFVPVIGNTLRPQQGIDNEILEQIATSAGIIADLTLARPSVYFEIGYARALGMPFILTCKDSYRESNDPVEKVHFDIRQYPIGFWKKENGEFIFTNPDDDPSVRISEVFG